MDLSFTYRDFLEEGLNTTVNQGSVFIGAYAEDYTNSINYGLIITARCDIAQNKAKKYSYLPLIPLNSWLKHDFIQLLYKRVIKGTEKTLISSFEAIGETELLLRTFSLEKLIEKFKDAGKEKQRKNFLKACEKKNY